jgi:putative oxidoreductase
VRILSWILQLAVAGILLQTLFFKFTGAAESVWIFSTLGAEPWGRYASGIAELIASVLLLAPGYAALGALLSLGVISGAIVSHVAFLGIEVQGDGGLLFALAVIVFICSLAILALRWRELPFADELTTSATATSSSSSSSGAR